MADNNGKPEIRVLGIDWQGRKWSESVAPINLATEEPVPTELHPSPDGKYLAVETVYGEQIGLNILERSSGRVWCPFDKPEWCVGGFSGWMRDNRFLFRAGQGDRPKGVILGGVLVVDLDTGQYRQLELPTSPDGVYSIASNVSLNPDNTRLAYSVTYPENGKEISEVWTMRMDGQDKRLIRKVEGGGNTLSWAPTGKQLIHLYQPGTGRSSTDPYELWLLNSDGTGERLLARGQCYGPAWSPDGRHVAFAQADNLALYFSDWRGPGTNIYVADTVTGLITKLSSFEGRNNHSPTWSPDGKFVAFVSVIPVGDPETYSPGLVYVEVWTASVDGKQLYALSGTARWPGTLAWLPSLPSAQEK